MKSRFLAHAVIVASVAVTSAALGAPVLWTCESSTYPGGSPFTYAIDLDARTVDGNSASLSGRTIVLTQAATGGERLSTSINLETGALAVDGDVRGSINRGACTSASLAQAPSSGTSGKPANEAAAPDERQVDLKKAYATLIEQARTKKLTYLKAARLYQERFQSLYPEQAANASMNEYLAYMAVVGEKVDKKKLTEAEAQYELARKVSELQERAAAQQEAAARKAAQQAVAQKAAADVAAQKSRDEDSARQARAETAARQSAEERRLALQREIAERQFAEAEAQRKAESGAAIMQMGLQLLFPPRQKVCTGYWSGPMWVQTCN